MLRTRLAMLAALTATGVAVLTACGGVSGTPVATSAGGAVAALPVSFLTGTAQQNGFGSAPANDNTGGQWAELDAGSAGSLNPVVRDGAGRTLYRFDKDSAKPPTSNCNGDCAKTWPPVTVKKGGRILLNGVDRKDVGTLARPDGTMQVTVGGWPVYRYSKDTAAGQANGQGVQNVWFAVTPEGGKASASAQGMDQATGVDYQTGTAKENGADLTKGDDFQGPRTDPAAMKWVQLTRGSAGGLNPIVHDGAGRTLYRFDKDSAKPPTSNCNGDCAKTWPPVLVQSGSRIFVNGVTTAKVGIVSRADGTRQVTIGGWPLYRYSGDQKAGDTNGEGVGGTWFAVSPTGGKVQPAAGAPAPASTPAPPSSTGVTLGNGVAILDSGKNFTEPAGSASISGPGCVGVQNPGNVSSIKLTGGPVKLWKGPNCTGQSTIITGSIPDLGTIGFDKAVASIRFGDQ
jgi:predicted lipoprotein with Yx(FWY)xxD motif